MAAVILLILTMLVLPLVWWQSKQNAKQFEVMYEEGKKAYEKGNYANAIKLFIDTILTDILNPKCQEIVQDIDKTCKKSGTKLDVEGLKQALNKLKSKKRINTELVTEVIADVKKISAGRPKKLIDEVEVFFEPRRVLQMLTDSGTQVGIPITQAGAMKAIAEADRFLLLGGRLINHFKSYPCGIKKKREADDSEWESFINGKSNGRRWRRWNAETTQGRWNVVVYYA